MKAIAFAMMLAFAPAAAQDEPAAPQGPGRVFIASDSTAAHYGASQYPQMGWGMFLPCVLPTDVQVINRARGGRSTKTFVEEGLWKQLLGMLRPGDTVLIQFGHNDEDTKKMFRHVDPPQYAENLARFVADVRAQQAVPVLMTPIARDEFENGHIKETHGAWADAVRRVAAETKAPLVDLDAAAMRFLDRVGPGKADSYFMIYSAADGIARFPEGHHDTTHLNERGARAAAAIVGRGLATLDLPFSDQVHAPDPAAVTPTGTPTCW